MPSTTPVDHQALKNAIEQYQAACEDGNERTPEMEEYWQSIFAEALGISLD